MNGRTSEAVRRQEVLADVDSPERLRALRATGLLDTAPEEPFDKLTQLVCRLLRVPVSLVSLVGADRQFFKSQQGLPEPWAKARETPLSHSFCQHVVLRQEPFVIDDARSDPLVCENLAIPDLGVAAYLGVPLTTPEGHVLGQDPPAGATARRQRGIRVWVSAGPRAIVAHHRPARTCPRPQAAGARAGAT